MVRRSISMSQWLRGGLAFLGAGRSPAAVNAVAPQTRHSQLAGISASAANGTVKRWPLRAVESHLLAGCQVGVAVVLVARGSEPGAA